MSTPGDVDVSNLRSFASTNRFLRELRSESRRSGYVLLGDEAFLYQRCRQGVLDTLLPEGARNFGLHDLDLAVTSLFDALDLAQTPSLMAPEVVLFLRNIKVLYGRTQKKEEFAALDAYFRRPNPAATLLFVADHITVPQDLRSMEVQDRERADRIRETLGDTCGMVELQRVSGEDAAVWARAQATANGVELDSEAARELVDALSADMLSVSSELEKLLLHAGAQGSKRIALADVETMVTSAKQRSLYELTDAISRKDAPRSLALLAGVLNSSESGEDAAIAHVFSLARAFRQMLVLQEKNVRDQRGLWAALWPGFRVPPFAADALIAQTRRYRDSTELGAALRLIARADFQLRSNAPDKRLVLERLVLNLAQREAAINSIAQES